jgi:hypothetical protein
MLQSFHQSGEQFEILFNKGKYDALPAELKAIIDYAVQAASADMSWKADRAQFQGLHRAEDQGQGQLLQDARRHPARRSWTPGTRSSPRRRREPAVQEGARLQKAFAERAGQWQNDYMVDFKMAWNHYFRRARRPDLPQADRATGCAAGGPDFSTAAETQHTMQKLLLGVDRCPPGWASSSPG